MVAHKRTIAIALASALILLLTAAFAGISFVRRGLSARDNPSAIEKILARKM